MMISLLFHGLVSCLRFFSGRNSRLATEWQSNLVLADVYDVQRHEAPIPFSVPEQQTS